jgi:hypothetical protein
VDAASEKLLRSYVHMHFRQSCMMEGSRRIMWIIVIVLRSTRRHMSL